MHRCLIQCGGIRQSSWVRRQREGNGRFAGGVQRHHDHCFVAVFIRRTDQRRLHLGHGAKSVFRSYRQRPVNSVEQVGAVAPSARLDCWFQRIVQQPLSRFCWGMTGDTAVQHGAQSVNIGPGAVAVIAGGVLLRWRIAGCDQAGDALAMAANRLPRRAKIDQDHPMVAGSDVQVGGLDVAVQESLIMNRLQRRQHVLQQTAHLVLAESLAILENRAQWFAFLIIHHDIGSAVGAEIALDPHNERVLNPRQHPRLIEKPLQPPNVVGSLIIGIAGLTLGVGVNRHAIGVTERPLHRKVFLDGDPVLQMGVQRLVSNAEAAGAENGVNPVFVQRTAGRQGVSAAGAALDRSVWIWASGHDSEPVAVRNWPLGNSKVGIARGAREGDHVPDVAHTGHITDRAFKA